MLLLPDWLRWLWVVVFLGVVAVHCGHAVTIRGGHRAWHAGHVVMGIGMAAMVTPGGVAVGSRATLEAVFVGCTALVLVWIGRELAIRRTVSPLWVGSLLDMAAMSYMLAVAVVPALTGVFVGYFALVALAWSTGVLPRMVDSRPSGLTSSVSVDQRLSLAGMATGMAYVFLAMAVG